MRLALALALALSGSTVATLFIACDGNETGATPTTDAGTTNGEGGSSSSGGEPGDGSSCPPDAKCSPDGCILKTTDYTRGKKVENVPRTDFPNGGVNWTNPTGALSEDGAFASITLAPGQESASLRVSDFGFDIPETAATWGIEVELKRQAPDGGVQDARIELEIEGQTPRFKYLDGGWPRTIVGTHPYGQAIDTWGVDLYPKHVNSSKFAAKVSAKRLPGVTGAVKGVIDSIKVAVWYCPNPPKQ
jgi:hypothetical protein